MPSGPVALFAARHAADGSACSSEMAMSFSRLSLCDAILAEHRSRNVLFSAEKVFLGRGANDIVCELFDYSFGVCFCSMLPCGFYFFGIGCVPIWCYV